MKKFLLILLALTMCVSMCACNGNQENASEAISNQSEASQIEHINIDTLLSALDNQARAELNIGKRTTMFVSVTNIYSDYCEVKHVFYNQTSKVYMPKEELAKLEKEEFVTFSAVVDSVEISENVGTTFIYNFKKSEVEDITLFDEYVSKKASSYSASDIVKKHRVFLENYVNERRSSFRMEDDDEIYDFLIGTWYHPFETGSFSPLIAECTFYNNGTVDWEFYDTSSGKWEPHTNKWSVSDGHLDFFISGGGYVYKISDDVFVCAGDVFART